MERRNKRDAKFLIFQSLYIIAISILFYKGTDLSLNKVFQKNPSDTIIAKRDLPTDLYDPSTEIVMPKPAENARYQTVLLRDTIVAKDALVEKDRRISELERLKTPDRTPVRQPKTNEPTPKTSIKGGTLEEK